MPILVCCHNQYQLDDFVRHTGIEVQVVRSAHSLRGRPSDMVLYLLPGWQTTGDAKGKRQAVAEWKALKRKCVRVPDAVVLGEEKMLFPPQIKGVPK